MGKTGRVNVSDVAFANAVKQVSGSGGTLAEVASLTGLKVGSVSTRLANWRKRGLPVPSFRGNSGGAGRKLDTDKISAIFNG